MEYTEDGRGGPWNLSAHAQSGVGATDLEREMTRDLGRARILIATAAMLLISACAAENASPETSPRTASDTTTTRARSSSSATSPSPDSTSPDESFVTISADGAWTLKLPEKWIAIDDLVGATAALELSEDYWEAEVFAAVEQWGDRLTLAAVSPEGNNVFGIAVPAFPFRDDLDAAVASLRRGAMLTNGCFERWCTMRCARGCSATWMRSSARC